MTALDNIKAALEAGPTEGVWEADIPDGSWADAAYIRVHNWGIVARVGLDNSLPHWDGPQRANAALIAACNPSAIRELLEYVESLERERDAFKQTVQDEIEENLRFRELGKAEPDECMPVFLERVIAERVALQDKVESLEAKAARSEAAAAAFEREQDRADAAEIRAELAEKDAARYQFIRTQFRAMSLDMGGNHCWVQARSGALRGPNIDAAIDAAMEQTK